MPDLQAWQWLLGALAAALIGVAKTGVPGIGAFIVPLMVLTIGDARHAAAWTVLMLITGDLIAITYWRRHARWRTLLSLIPWVAIGMGGGAAALALPESILRRLVGAIILAMLVLAAARRKGLFRGREHDSIYGIPAGFATTVANAAGPVMNIYLLSRQLPKEEFVATAAWFFFTVNVSKIPIYAAYGLFEGGSLGFAGLMVPVVVSGGVAGIWLIRRLPQRVFELTIEILTLLAALALLL